MLSLLPATLATPTRVAGLFARHLRGCVRPRLEALAAQRSSATRAQPSADAASIAAEVDAVEVPDTGGGAGAGTPGVHQLGPKGRSTGAVAEGTSASAARPAGMPAGASSPARTRPWARCPSGATFFWGCKQSSQLHCGVPAQRQSVTANIPLSLLGANALQAAAIRDACYRSCQEREPRGPRRAARSCISTRSTSWLAAPMCKVCTLRCGGMCDLHSTVRSAASRAGQSQCRRCDDGVKASCGSGPCSSACKCVRVLGRPRVHGVLLRHVRTCS